MAEQKQTEYQLVVFTIGDEEFGVDISQVREIVRVEVGENTVGMIVDSVSEVLRLSSEFVEAVPSLVEAEVQEHYIRGVGKLKDRLLVLLDLNKILSPEEFQHVEKHVEKHLKDIEVKEK